jgi:DNA-directed RNA polymerase specialized sigma24 family protein
LGRAGKKIAQIRWKRGLGFKAVDFVDENTPLADRLRDGEVTWRLVETEIVPRVLAALERRYGPGRHGHDLEGFVRSAQRTACRRLQAGSDQRLEGLETLAQLEDWLVVVAGHKFHRALVRAGIEEAIRPVLSNASAHRDVLEELTQQSAEEVVADLEAGLEDDLSRAVFQGKIQKKTEAEIAAGLKCSTSKVRGVWRRIRQRLLRTAAEVAS